MDSKWFEEKEKLDKYINLRCICPNCDSQLDTYKSKNKNGDRYYYRYHKEKQNGN